MPSVQIHPVINQRWYIQQQSLLNYFNGTGGSSGTWASSGSQMIRVDAGSVQTNKNAPYMRVPVLTGARSEVVGVRGRKGQGWSMRLPFIPSGVASTPPDCDIILQNIFGQANAAGTYSFLDTGYLPFSLFGFVHGFPNLTARALWGCYVSRSTWEFNQNFITLALDGFAGYSVTSNAFAAYDTLAKAGLTAFPTEPGTPTVSGSPIPGFGTGYTCTLHSQTLEMKTKVLSIQLETGWTPIADVYGSPYLAAVVGSTRRVSLNCTMIDDDSSALTDIKTQCETDGATITATIVAGNTTHNIFTFTLNTVQPNAFNLRDNGVLNVDFEMPTSYGHASASGLTDDYTIAFS